VLARLVHPSVEEAPLNALSEARRLIIPPAGDRDGPLVPLLLILTVVTGLVDAFSFLALGHVFVANATGNVVFLAFALAGAHGFSIGASVLALTAFSAGALAGGRTIALLGSDRARLLAVATAAEALFVVGAVLLARGSTGLDAGWLRYALIGVLAAPMGLQNAVARRLAVADLTTTVLTLTLTAISADSGLAGGQGSRLGRRLPALLAMLLGALIGGWLVVSGRAPIDLAIAAAGLVAVAAATVVAARADPPWARPAASRDAAAGVRTGQ